MSSDGAKVGRGGSALYVEIGNDWAKVLQAEPARGGASASRLHLETFTAAGPELSRSLSQALKRGRFSRGPAIGCLPRSMVNVRILELPSTDPEEIADMVDLQAGKQTPYSKDEIVSDYRILGEGRAGYTRVMLVIVQRTVLRERYYLIEEAGLDVRSMTVSTEGLLNWFLRLADGRDWGRGTVMLLDVDSFYTDCLVLTDRRLAFSRSVLLGANELAADPAKARERLAREAKRSIEMFQAEAAGAGPSRILLSGAGPRIERLAEDLGAALGLPVEAADCRRELVRVPEGYPAPESPAGRTVSLTALVGMAMAPGALEFGLIPDSVKLRKDLAAKSRGLSLLAMLCMAVLVSLSAGASGKLFLKRAHRDDLRAESEQTRPGVERVERMRKLIDVAGARRETGLSALALLREVHRLSPLEVSYDAVEFDTRAGRLMLGGMTDDRKHVRALISNLEGSPLYANVQQSGEKIEKGGRVRFQITGVLERKP